MSYDPNQPQQPDSGQPPQSPYGQPQPPYGQPGQPQQPSYGQPPGGEQPPPYSGQPGQPQQPPYGQPQWTPPYAPTQYVAPAYGTPPAPGYAPQQPRKSRRALWIVLGIIGGLLLLSCAVCGITAVAGIGFFARTVAAPLDTANNYYNAIKAQNYSTAYSYLDTNLIATNGQALTQDLYTTAAQALDSAKGTVTSFSTGNFSVNNDTASVTVSVTRGSAPAYDVHLQLKQVNGTWKITSFDNI